MGHCPRLPGKMCNLLAGEKRRLQAEGFDLDLTYITSRVLVVGIALYYTPTRVQYSRSVLATVCYATCPATLRKCKPTHRIQLKAVMRPPLRRGLPQHLTGTHAAVSRTRSTLPALASWRPRAVSNARECRAAVLIAREFGGA
eukprot:3386923-Rhodomonas_salina.1